MNVHPVVWFVAGGSLLGDAAALVFGIAGSGLLSRSAPLAIGAGAVFVAVAIAAGLAGIAGKALALTIHSGLRHRW